MQQKRAPSIENCCHWSPCWCCCCFLCNSWTYCGLFVSAGCGNCARRCRVVHRRIQQIGRSDHALCAVCNCPNVVHFVQMKQRFVTTFCTDLKLQNCSHNSVVKEDFTSSGLIEISDNIKIIRRHRNSPQLQFFRQFTNHWISAKCLSRGRGIEVIKKWTCKITKKK